MQEKDIQCISSWRLKANAELANITLNKAHIVKSLNTNIIQKNQDSASGAKISFKQDKKGSKLKSVVVNHHL